MAAPLQDCVVLFGDSITSRQDVPGSFQSLMCEHYRRHLDILNRGYGGYNTTMAKPLLDKIFARKGTPGQPIRLVTIWFGANDAALPDPSSSASQHVPLPTYTANLREYLERLTSSSSPCAVAHAPLSVIVITPPPVCAATYDGKPRNTETARAYGQAALGVVREWQARAKEGQGVKWKVEGIDMCGAILKASGGEERLAEYFTDGLHLSTKGYAVLWQEYIKLVKGPLAGRGLDWDDLEDCPTRVPLWDDVDPTNPQSVLDGMKEAPFHSA